MVRIWVKGAKISIEMIFWKKHRNISEQLTAEIFQALPNQMHERWQESHLRAKTSASKPWDKQIPLCCNDVQRMHDHVRLRFDAYVRRAAHRLERWQVRRACSRCTAVWRVQAQSKWCAEEAATLWMVLRKHPCDKQEMLINTPDLWRTSGE